MTTGSEWRAILLFTLPIMGSNLLQVCYNLADSLIVGNFIGPAALGAVGLTGSMVWLLLTFCVGIGTGTSIVIAQYYGAERPHDIKLCVGAAYTLALIVSALLTIPCFVFAKPLVWGLLGAPAEMRGMSVLYFGICASGVVFQMLYNVTYGILRAHGDSRGGLLFLLIAAILNVVLDILFIVSFGWGVAGAALATVLAQAGCAAASVVYLVKKFPRLRPWLSLRKVVQARMWTIVRVSVPIIVQSAILSIGFTFLQRLVNSFGAPSIEGYASMTRIEALAHIPSNSFNSAVSAFTGQNIGAGKPERAQVGYRAALWMGVAIAIMLAVVVIFVGRPMLGMFNIAGESMRRGWEHLMLLMLFMPLSTVSNITSGFLQGTGDVRVPAVAGFVNLSVRLLLSYAMAGTLVDFRSIYFSMPLAWLVGCLIVVWRYRSGKWRGSALV